MSPRRPPPLPRPRNAHFLNCFIIALYSAGFFPFFIPWMQANTQQFVVKFGALLSFTFVAHFFILRERQLIYGLACRLLNTHIRFFEFIYVFIVGAFYLCTFLIAPIALQMIVFEGGIQGLLEREDKILHLLFTSGSILVAAFISGLDIYPVNLFRTREALRALIAITRDLMKACNRMILILSGSIVVGWAAKKVEFSPHVIYLTCYAITGLALGTTGVLGSRLTDMLYILSQLETLDSESMAKIVTRSVLPEQLVDD